VDVETILSVDTAFHCVPVEGQEDEYALQFTDISLNHREGDILKPDPPPMGDCDSNDADTRNLLSSMDHYDSGNADTRRKPAKPAAENKAPAKKRKAPVKEKKEPPKGRPTTSRKRKIAAEADEEEQEETEEVPQEKKAPAPKRTRRQVKRKG
jgi:hypothetical protein